MDDIDDQTLSQFAEKIEKEAKMWEGHENGLSDACLTQLANTLNESQIRLMATFNFGIDDLVKVNDE